MLLALLLAGYANGVNFGEGPPNVALFADLAPAQLEKRIAAECRARNFRADIIDLKNGVRVICTTASGLLKSPDVALQSKPQRRDTHPREIHAFYFDIAAKGADSVVTETLSLSSFSDIHASRATKGEMEALQKVNDRAAQMLAQLGGVLQP
jgi:hypothetical protein